MLDGAVPMLYHDPNVRPQSHRPLSFMQDARLPVSFSKNGKLKPEYAVNKGVDEHFPVGRYQVRAYEGGKRVWQDVGVNATDALAALAKTRHKQIAKASLATGVCRGSAA